MGLRDGGERTAELWEVLLASSGSCAMVDGVLTRDATRSLPYDCSVSSGTFGGRSGTRGPSSLIFGGRGGADCRSARELVSE